MMLDKFVRQLILSSSSRILSLELPQNCWFWTKKSGEISSVAKLNQYEHFCKCLVSLRIIKILCVVKRQIKKLHSFGELSIRSSKRLGKILICRKLTKIIYLLFLQIFLIGKNSDRKNFFNEKKMVLKV